MARDIVFLLLFFIGTAISDTSTNEAASSESEALSSDKLESSVQASPVDIEKNTAPLMRSDSSLNRFLSNPPNLPIEGSLNTDSLSIDNLANQLGVTVTEQNLLANINSFDTESSVQANEQQQSLNDYLNPNSLLGQGVDPLDQAQVNPLDALLNNPTQNQYTTLTKVYKSPPITLVAGNNEQLLNSVQALLQQPQVNQGNVYPQPGTLLTDANGNQLLNTLQTLMNQQNNGYPNNLYQTSDQVTDDNNVQTLTQSLLGQPDLGPSGLGNVFPVLNQGSNPLQSLGLDSLQDLSNLQNNLQQTNQVNLASLLQPPNNNGNNLETRLVFKTPLPNLHLSNCKAAFGYLMQSALLQYLKLAQLPYCQQSGANPFPSLNLPFEIVVVPSNSGSPTSDHSVLTKILWLLLNRLKNQPGPNQTDLITPIILELILKPVSAPDVLGPSVIPGQTQNLPLLLLLLKLLKYQSQTPSRANLYKIIVDIIKNQNPYGIDSVTNDFPNLLVPSSTPLPIVFPTDFPTPPPIIDTTDLPIVIPTIYPTLPPLFPTDVYPTDMYPTDDSLPTAYPTSPVIYPTSGPVSPTISPFDVLPTAQPDSPVLPISNPNVKYVVLILQKFLPQQQLTVQDLTFVLQLLNTLPKTYNELLLNPNLLKQVTNQLQNRNLNPQLLLSIIYKYLIQFSNQNLLVNDSNRVVVLKYQIKRQNPIVYQPYYYVLYKLPYAHFLKYLQQLVIVKPQLKQNRALLLKELLVLAVSSNNAVATDFNGVSKEYLVQLISNQGATPLDVKVVNENNVSYEQLKVMNDLQIGSDLSLLQTGDLNSELVEGSKIWETSGTNVWGTGSNILETTGTNTWGTTGPNLWAYLLQQAPIGVNQLQQTQVGVDQLMNLPTEDNYIQLPTANPFLRLLRRNDNREVNSQTNDAVLGSQNLSL